MEVIAKEIIELILVNWVRSNGVVQKLHPALRWKGLKLLNTILDVTFLTGPGIEFKNLIFNRRHFLMNPLMEKYSK